jgi:hypothetical protein
VAAQLAASEEGLSSVSKLVSMRFIVVIKQIILTVATNYPTSKHGMHESYVVVTNAREVFLCIVSILWY